MSEFNAQKKSGEGNNPEINDTFSGNTKSGRSNLKYIIFDGILFLLIFSFFLTTGLSSIPLSHMLFSKAQEVIEAPAIVGRDRLYGVEVIDDSSFWLVGNYGKILKTTDKGKSFFIQSSPVSSDLQDIGAWNKDQAVIVCDGGSILITEDGGNLWKEVSDVPKAEYANKLLRVLILKNGRAFAVGSMGMIMLTEDYGKTWARVSKSEDLAWNDITFADEKTGWVAGEFGSIMKTLDGGKTWELQNSKIDNSIMSIAAKDINNVRACSLEGVLLDTVDGGNSWSSFNTETKEHYLDIVNDGNSFVSIGTGGLLSFYDADTSKWKMQRLSANDFYWHTKIAKFGEDYIIVGQTSGILSQTEWKYF